MEYPLLKPHRTSRASSTPGPAFLSGSVVLQVYNHRKSLIHDLFYLRGERPEEKNASQTQGQGRGLDNQHQGAGLSPKQAGPEEREPRGGGTKERRGPEEAGLWEGVGNCEPEGLAENPRGELEVGGGRQVGGPAWVRRGLNRARLGWTAGCGSRSKPDFQSPFWLKESLGRGRGPPCGDLGANSRSGLRISTQESFKQR